jgi:D-serine deaminase-like pyridoxal phosphate-dependent protein
MKGRTIQDLDTPALLLELSVMERNLARMVQFIDQGPTRLRPHFKNHQCLWLSSKQIAAGAIGITCARVEHAEALVSHRISSVLIATEIAGDAKLSRCAELARQAELILAVDNPHVVADIGRIARNKRARLNVLVDVNVGQNRCGVEPGEAALSLAKAALEQGLVVRGVMGYEGHLNLRPPSPEKENACRAALQLAVDTRTLLERNDISCDIVSAGATGTYSITGRFPGVTELQAGSYLTMDTSFLQSTTDFERTLTVLATVISKADGKRLVIDSGRKALSGERGLPVVKTVQGVRLTALHAEHGIIECDNPLVPVEVGDKIEVWVQYADTTIQLHQRMYGVRAGRVEEELAIVK